MIGTKNQVGFVLTVAAIIRNNIGTPPSPRAFASVSRSFFEIFNFSGSR